MTVDEISVLRGKIEHRSGLIGSMFRFIIRNDVPYFKERIKLEIKMEVKSGNE